jgi:hypothetical protein
MRTEHAKRPVYETEVHCYDLVVLFGWVTAVHLHNSQILLGDAPSEKLAECNFYETKKI